MFIYTSTPFLAANHSFEPLSTNPTTHYFHPYQITQLITHPIINSLLLSSTNPLTLSPIFIHPLISFLIHLLIAPTAIIATMHLTDSTHLPLPLAHPFHQISTHPPGNNNNNNNQGREGMVPKDLCTIIPMIRTPPTIPPQGGVVLVTPPPPPPRRLEILWHTK